MIVSSIALSHRLEEQDPVAALALFPLNAEARVRHITAELTTAKPDDLADLERRFRLALRYDSGDARFYSLLGELEYRRGDAAAAGQWFDKARALSKTEVHALRRDILRAVELGDVARAVGKIDVLLRRWPELSPKVARALPRVLAESAGFAAVVDVLAADAPWRGTLFRQLAADPVGIGFADRLLLDLRHSALPPRPDELAAVISNYIKAGQYDAAYRLFRFSLSDDEQKIAGYVYNGGFAPAPSRRPFDWQLREQSGMEFTFAGEGESGAKLRFLNRPLKGALVQQYLLLPPGDYTLTLNASGTGLSLPKDLFWSVECMGPRKTELARLAIPHGTFERHDLAAGFSVPPADCTAQLLKLETSVVAQSWRYRYLGELTMHAVRVGRQAS